MPTFLLLWTPRFLYFHFQTCNPQPQLTLTKVKSLEAVYQTSHGFLWSHKSPYTAFFTYATRPACRLWRKICGVSLQIAVRKDHGMIILSRVLTIVSKRKKMPDAPEGSVFLCTDDVGLNMAFSSSSCWSLDWMYDCFKALKTWLQTLVTVWVWFN